jgi:hypothetical protein
METYGVNGTFNVYSLSRARFYVSIGSKGYVSYGTYGTLISYGTKRFKYNDFIVFV